MQQVAIIHITNILKDEKFKEALVKRLNEHVDIPMLNEKTEEKVFNAIYDIIQSTLVSFT